ncbi:CAP domain-containing protein [Nocardioides sp.]|uniref:CAP domain-containing protein n=1 Tax=Nocardioides sp. TaxID=35761 RepID=UPI002728F2B6|nr:CAP domain-containing protein [Nocardioides sp.]MDO9454818.1 CAP domain-containing protein [Nocardioides sp.]
MRRTPHTALMLASLLITALVALTTSPSYAAPTPTEQASPAARTPGAGTIVGWAKAPSAVRAGSVYAARVRVAGANRPVHLQRKVGNGWRTVAKTRSNRNGRVALHWKSPRATGKVTLRVMAPRHNARRLALTWVRVVVVRAVPSASPANGPLSPLLREVLTLVNKTRSTGYSCGGVAYPAVPAVQLNTKLNAAAGKYARLMAARDWFSHNSPNGASAGDRIDAEGYHWMSYGENIAAGHTEAASVVQGWLDSDGHCKNLMGNYSEIGLGYAYNADSYYGHYWVQDFATR